MSSVRIGVDLGGTKIEAIALDHAGQTLARQRVATPQGDYVATLHAVTAPSNSNWGRRAVLESGHRVRCHPLQA